MTGVDNLFWSRMEIKSVCFWLVYWLFKVTRAFVDGFFVASLRSALIASARLEILFKQRLFSLFFFVLHLLYPPMTEKIDAIADLHRRISTFETKHLEHEIEELRYVFFDILIRSFIYIEPWFALCLTKRRRLVNC